MLDLRVPPPLQVPITKRGISQVNKNTPDLKLHAVYIVLLDGALHSNNKIYNTIALSLQVVCVCRLHVGTGSPLAHHMSSHQNESYGRSGLAMLLRGYTHFWLTETTMEEDSGELE